MSLGQAETLSFHRVIVGPEEARAPHWQEAFSERELADLARLAPVRRADRVAGRLAAKRALAESWAASGIRPPELKNLEIFNDPAGRPILNGVDFGAAPSFSIAHCAGTGVAAVGDRVGIDIELVFERPLEILRFIAGPDDVLPGPGEGLRAQARFWTGKEAALKLLGLGLDADPEQVRIDGGVVRYTGGRPAGAWAGIGRPEVRLIAEDVGNLVLSVAYTEEI